MSIQSAASTLTTETPESPVAPEAPATETPSTETPSKEEPSQETPDIDTEDKEPSKDFGKASDPDLAAAFDEIDSPPKKKGDEPDAKKPAEQKSEDDKPTVPPLEDDPRMPKQLRERVKEQNRLLSAAEQEKKDLQAKIQLLESKGVEDPAVTEAVKARDKRIEQLQAQIAGLEFQESEEFKKTYEKPFNKAAAAARTFMSELEVLEEDESGMASTRKADWDKDFVQLYHLPAGKLVAAANQKFGAAASLVISRIERLKELQTNMDEARAEEESQWKERASERTTQQKMAAEKNAQLWQKVNSEIASKHEDWFAHDAKDDEAATALKKATELADHYFSNRFATLPQADQILMEAQMRQRFIALPMVMRRLKSLEDQLAKANEQLNNYKGSDPNAPTRRSGGSRVHAEGDPESSLRPILEEAFD